MRAKDFEIKHRDPNWKTLQAKRTSGAAGAHKDQKKAMKQGDVKHKKDLTAEDSNLEATAGFQDVTGWSSQDIKRLGHEDDDTPSQYGVFINGKLWKKFATREEANRVSLSIERKYGKPTSVRSI